MWMLGGSYYKGVKKLNCRRLEGFASLLAQWGRIHNLTAVADLESIRDNIESSLYPTNFLLPFNTCVDVGSGAGFPALPLACHYEDSFFYLLEPRKKRAAFLNHVICQLELKNAKVIAEFSHKVRGIKANLLTSRAVCSGEGLLDKSRHLVREDGKYLLFKGEKSLSESLAIKGYDTKVFSHKQYKYVYLSSA